MSINYIEKKIPNFEQYEKLSKICFPNFKTSYQWYQWYNFNCPTGQKHEYQILEDKKLIGLLGCLPIKIKVNDETLNGGLLTNGMIHPEYRGKNLFVELEKFLIDSERRSGSKLLLGVPNRYIFRSHLRCDLRVLDNLDIIGKFNFSDRPGDCREIFRFDDSYQYLQRRMKEKTNMYIVKDPDYLNWRYFMRPDKKYRCFAYYEGDTPIGWIVIGEYDEKGYKKTHIIDINATSIDIFKKLIRAAENLAHGRHELNCWNSAYSTYRRWFLESGFIPTTEKNVLIGKGLDLDTEHIKKEDWWFCFGDNDVY